MEDENEEKIDTFDYFNTDINLLVLHILLEGFYRGQNIFTLEQFLKGDYWKIEELNEEVIDTNDYGSVEDLVLHQVVRMIKDLNMGTIKRISVKNLRKLTEKVIRGAVEEKEGTENEVMYFTGIIDEIYNLKKLEDLQNDKKIKAKKPYDRETWNRVDFTENDFGKHLQYSSAISAPFIELEIDFNDKGVLAVNKEIDEYIFSFCQNDYIEKKPVYREKRYYFSKQIENFFEYIRNFPVVEGYINIPFSSLSEQGFEVIKVLSYLEKEKRIKVCNWNDMQLWNVKFNKIPITLTSLLGQEEIKENKPITEKEIKLNLSFSPQTGIMILTDQNNKEYKIRIQGQVQKEVLRVIFQNPKNTYTVWSLYEISDILGRDDVDETAVKNAIYQFNKKVKLNITDIESLFELTKHSATLNPKYINKN